MAQHTITLDDYEVANLRALIEACGYPASPGNNDPKWRPGVPDSPLRSLSTGDWIGQIYWKLPAVDYAPNHTPEAMVANVAQYGFGVRCEMSRDEMDSDAEPLGHCVVHGEYWTDDCYRCHPLGEKNEA